MVACVVEVCPHRIRRGARAVAPASLVVGPVGDHRRRVPPRYERTALVTRTEAAHLGDMMGDSWAHGATGW